MNANYGQWNSPLLSPKARVFATPAQGKTVISLKMMEVSQVLDIVTAILAGNLSCAAQVK